MTDMSMIARVAYAICEAEIHPFGGTATPRDRSFVRKNHNKRVAIARAAIVALREPTEAMVEAGNLKIWRAMIDEALKDDGTQTDPASSNWQDTRL